LRGLLGRATVDERQRRTDGEGSASQGEDLFEGALGGRFYRGQPVIGLNFYEHLTLADGVSYALSPAKNRGG
jgi:hypothetical protein